jgi:hypothetical protein
LLLVLAACSAPPGPSLAPSPSTPTPSTPAGCEAPLEVLLREDLPSLRLSVDPLVAGTATVLRVESAPADAVVQLWQGAIGGVSCPDGLSVCLDLGCAVPLGEVVADAAGTAALTWPVAGAEGDYPAFQATIDGTSARSQVVMRGVHTVWPPATLFPDGLARLGEDVNLPPGDYFELLSSVIAVFPLRGGTHVEATVTRDPDFDRDGYWTFDTTDPLAEIDHDYTTWTADLRDTSEIWVQMATEYGWGDPGPWSLRVEATLPASPHDWTADTDLDGFGDGAPVTTALAPDGYVWRDGDCDDTDPSSFPFAVDECEDGIDQDCTGLDRSCHPTLGGTQRIEDVAFAVAIADRSLQQLAPAGDRDGDGLPDLVVTDEETASIWGEPLRGTVLEPDARLTGLCCWGRMDADSPGDIDGDGRDDLLIVDYSQNDYDGAAYLVTDLLSGDNDVAAVARTTFLGPSEKKLQAVGRVGDASGDGVPDVLVATPRADRAYLFVQPPAGSVAVGDADVIFQAPNLGSDGGGADLDGDGISELMVSQLYSGQIWVLQGPFSGVVDVAETGTLITGGREDYELIVHTGDVNADGHTDLATKLSYEPGIGIALGPLADGGVLADITVLDGSEVALAGDLDGDGAAELVAGSWDTELDDRPAGLVGVFAGPVAAGVYSLVEADAVWTGGTAGFQLIGPGDIDGDGLGDLAVGGRTQTWLVHGAPF